MLEIQVQEVNNGFIVNVQLIQKMLPMPTQPINFKDLMAEGAAAMVKQMNKDTVLSEIEDANKKEEEINSYLGVHVFLKYSEVLTFLSLLKD